MTLTLGTIALKTLPCNEESTDMQMSQVVLILKNSKLCLPNSQIHNVRK